MWQAVSKQSDNWDSIRQKNSTCKNFEDTTKRKPSTGKCERPRLQRDERFRPLLLHHLGCDRSQRALSPSMSQKPVDLRIPALIRNGLQERKRSFFVLLGERPKEVIVYLHYILTNFDLKQDKSVLWAYHKKLLDFTR